MCAGRNELELTSLFEATKQRLNLLHGVCWPGNEHKVNILGKSTKTVPIIFGRLYGHFEALCIFRIVRFVIL